MLRRLDQRSALHVYTAALQASQQLCAEHFGPAKRVLFLVPRECTAKDGLGVVRRLSQCWSFNTQSLDALEQLHMSCIGAL